MVLKKHFTIVVLQPFKSVKDSNNKCTHTATDISKDASVQAIANVAWIDSAKNIPQNLGRKSDSLMTKMTKMQRLDHAIDSFKVYQEH